MKLRITIDIFSGRPNPQWTIDDRPVVERLVQQLAGNPDAVAASSDAVPPTLGLRALYVDVLSDNAPAHLAQRFILAPGTHDPAASAWLGEELLATAPRTSTDLPPEFLDSVRDGIRQWPDAAGGGDRRLSGAGPSGRKGAAPQLVCPFDTAPFNPAFWNAPEVQPYNNCYNYATNLATDTYAQPGRAHGYAIPPTCTCAEVAHGAELDGYRADGNCQPPTTTDRWLVALVTGTFPGGIRDYHWYRLQSEGFWGHKGGEGPATNLDNAGHIIYDPQTCDRGYYTNWCGYYLCSNLVVIL